MLVETCFIEVYFNKVALICLAYGGLYHGGEINSLSFGYAKEEAVYGLENSDISCNKMITTYG